MLRSSARLLRSRASLRRRLVCAIKRSRFSPTSGALAPASPLAPAVHRAFHLSATPFAKVVPFTLSDIGEGIAEVEVRQVFVKPGDEIEEFDKVMEVESDKDVKFSAGDVAPTGSVLMDIEVTGEDADKDAGEEEPSSSSSSPAPSPSPSPAAAPAPSAGGGGGGGGAPAGAARQKRDSQGKPLATPAVRRIARENKVDLYDVPGTGKDGRILKSDILSFVAGVETPATAVPPTPEMPPAAGLTAPDRTEPIRGLKRAMVKSMNQSWQVPHFGYCDEVTVDGLIALREQLKPLATERGIKFSYMPLIIKATSLALNHYPELNAHTNEDCTEITYRGSHNIGVAMDTPRGLIVPNVKDVQAKSVLEIAEELGVLQELAKEGRLSEAQLKDGTFALSNIGAIGGTYAAPVIMAPQVAIGAIGKMQKVPRYHKDPVSQEDVVKPTHILRMSWSADHRVVDGATMARFSNLWRSFLESPTTMLAAMR